MHHEPLDQLNLLLHHEVVRAVQAEPGLPDIALGVLDDWNKHMSCHSKPLRDRWVQIIKARDWAAALEESDRGQQLRQASPIACFVPDAARHRIIDSMRSILPAGLESLQAKYPLIFSRNPPRGGPGWLNLLDQLCRQLQAHADAGGQQARALSAREKWGRLDLRFDQLAPELESLVADAQVRSKTICDVCGEPGGPVPELWHRTRCEQHWGTPPWWPTSARPS